MADGGCCRVLPGAWEEGIPAKGRLVVGFSGGADSVALAHWLMGRVAKDRLLLAHVNHQLRGEEALRDQRFVEDFARAWGLEIAVLQAGVATLARERGQGLEECGREVRYGFFHQLAAGEEDRVLTAHNADDNAETILMHLCRGAGGGGLCGIPRQRGKILRPLLGVAREEIETYCRAQGLAFVTDSSNLEEDYARNRVRHRVMPVLRELNPRFVQAAGQAAALLSADQAFLGEQAAALRARARNRWGLETAVLLAAHESLRSRALRLYLEEAGCRQLERKHLLLAESLLAGGGADLPGGVAVHCAQGVFWAGPMLPGEDYQMPVKPGTFYLPGGLRLTLRRLYTRQGRVRLRAFRPGPAGGQKGPERLAGRAFRKKMEAEIENQEKIQNLLFKNALDCAIMNGNLIVRNRRPGDRFAPVGRKLSKPLKQVFQELRVPAPLRGRIPLLAWNRQVVWCPGAGAAEGFAAGRDAQAVWVVEIAEE
ncbi:tRNA lysidine(34) synthetase TilS [Acutalibacter caecimuris]|uniref:tRNA lysidine(34) synthetase TilS n=1 Tax=Acutalibacter caecimuris TaxID=3093657 RepID=UPI002AC8BD7C|nr:tRNA lysidine(34) synthetase TilS [Acutalibacter sp. M00118]